jgi:hypothetical protein
VHHPGLSCPLYSQLRRYSRFLTETCNFPRIYSTNVESRKHLINSLSNTVLHSNKLEKMNVFASKYKVFMSVIINLEALDMAILLLRWNCLLFFRLFSLRLPRKGNNDTTFLSYLTWMALVDQDLRTDSIKPSDVCFAFRISRVWFSSTKSPIYTTFLLVSQKKHFKIGHGTLFSAFLKIHSSQSSYC